MTGWILVVCALEKQGAGWALVGIMVAEYSRLVDAVTNPLIEMFLHPTSSSSSSSTSATTASCYSFSTTSSTCITSSTIITTPHHSIYIVLSLLCVIVRNKLFCS
jgi:hypothetical protein